MEYKTAAVKNPKGVHLRVAAEIVRICRKYNSRIYLSCKDCPYIDACSIIHIMLLEATKGSFVTIKADGPDEKEAVSEVSQFFMDRAGI